MLITCLAAQLLSACATEQSSPLAHGAGAPVGWPTYASDAGGTRYSPLSDINADNVHRLQPAWVWRSEERALVDEAHAPAAGRFEVTPLAIGDTLYLSTPFNRVISLDARTGREHWQFDPRATAHPLTGDRRGGFVHRGVASWRSPSAHRILIASRWRLWSLNAATGRPDSAFGEHGSVSLLPGLRWEADSLLLNNTSPPLVWDSIVVVGSAIDDRMIFDRDPPGAVQAFDVRSGRLLWSWGAIPADSMAAAQSWGGGSSQHVGHGNVWAPMSADSSRGLVFLPVSAASNDFYGGGRPGDNRHTQSIVCLDIRTGRLVWAQQIVHHDIWDYDPASPPALATVERGGVPQDVVVFPGKTGFLYVFDRERGDPVWPTENRPVKASDVPGEVASATQPVPTWPLPFARQGFTETDLVDFTPEILSLAKARLAEFRSGTLFTPPSQQGTVQSPGWIGGAGWGAMAVDPVRRVAYIKSSEWPTLARVVPTSDARRFIGDTIADPAAPLSVEVEGRKWFGLRRTTLRLPIVRPPYGTLTAIDLDSGNQLWQIPIGDTPHIRRHPLLRGLDLPPLGIWGAPGPVATAAGLLFLTGGGSELFAIDAATGRVLHAADLDLAGYSNPMTYRASDGVQYVVVATGANRDIRLQAFQLAGGAR